MRMVEVCPGKWVNPRAVISVMVKEPDDALPPRVVVTLQNDDSVVVNHETLDEAIEGMAGIVARLCNPPGGDGVMV